MKHYYFDLDMYKKANGGRSILWAERSDGHEVIDGKITGTPYVCSDSSRAVWCRCVDDETKIEITTDGKTTTASLYESGKVVKSGTARCNPSDTFSLETGAKLALERLCEKPKYDYEKVKEKIIEKYCRGQSCRDCILQKYAESKGKDMCSEVVRFYDIRVGGYTPEFIENLISDLEKFEKDLIKKENKYYSGKVVCVERSNNSMAYTVGKVYEFVNGKVKIDNGNTAPLSYAIKSLDDWNKQYGKIFYAKFIPLVD